MELDELEPRLQAFARAHHDDSAVVDAVHKMPGHAGFAYGFRVTFRGDDGEPRQARWFLRLPPPDVKWQGTADVLRQVAVLGALDGTDVPHCSVRWSGDDLRWFGRPYFMVPQLDGDVLRLTPGEWAAALAPEVLHDLGRQAMTALAGVHRLDHRQLPYLGAPIPFADDVERWDRFVDRAPDPAQMRLQPQVRARLLATLPADAPVGVFHGDFQTANLFCSFSGRLLAVIDWELVGVGATLNDVGWICTFSDRAAWAEGSGRATFLDPDTLVRMYREAWGAPLPDLGWYRALAAYKFAIISGLNLSLHRRGKRHDPAWEVTALSIEPLLRRALDLLG